VLLNTHTIQAMDIAAAVAAFAQSLSNLIEKQVMERARTAVLEAFGGTPRRGPGRPAKAAAPLGAAISPKKKMRKKAPLQLCPVPGCKNPAAPVFGMVCAKHKDLPKGKIKKFREARRAKRLDVKSATKAKRPARKARRGRKVGNSAKPPVATLASAAASA
jgi:hypothetical protein